MRIDIDKIIDQLKYNPKDPLLFNSGFFLFFIVVVLLFYQFIHRKKLTRVVFFTLFSLYFFYKACGVFVLLIILSAVIDFSLSNWIYKTKKPFAKAILLIFSITINLGMLFYFKYTNLFIGIINDLQLGQVNPLHLILPIGISFYTFENLSYTIDVYRGHFKPITSFLDYLFFLSFFPKLVMGPIVRASDFIPQIRQDILITETDIGRGLYLILGGLIKKVVISDYINANFVQYIFDDPARYSGVECLLAVYGYAMVIYCDFSGYSDMAIGMAQWMGFKIPMNFDVPYQSSNITDFWRRWHISLSSWLKDYLYVSLGGNRKGKIRIYINLMITMLLGGLWHGANLKFAFWGGMHGVALAFDKIMKVLREKITGRSKKRPWINSHIGLINTIWKVLGVFITFHFVCYCWIFFKSDSFEKANIVVHQILHNFNTSTILTILSAYQSVFIIMGAGYLIHFTPKSVLKWIENIITDMPVIGRVAITFLVIWLVIQVNQSEQIMPIYFQF